MTPLMETVSGCYTTFVIDVVVFKVFSIHVAGPDVGQGFSIFSDILTFVSISIGPFF